MQICPEMDFDCEPIFVRSFAMEGYLELDLSPVTCMEHHLKFASSHLQFPC